MGDILVPKSVDSTAGTSVELAILIDAIILGLFAVQHTIMARPWFKAGIAKLIPRAAERSTFVLLASLILLLIFWQWRPIAGTIWTVQSPLGQDVLWALFWIGWGIVFISTFLIDHFDLFGLRQVTAYLMGKEPQLPHFTERAFYKVVRHPIMLGFIIAFWATPTMSIGHLFFAGLTTAYILVGLLFEERDLVRMHGERYLEYASRVPRLVPFLKLGHSGPRPSPEVKDE